MTRSSKRTPPAHKATKRGKASNPDDEPVELGQAAGSRQPGSALTGADAPAGDSDHRTPGVDAASICADLRLLAHRILADQESDCRDISHWLNDDIAQMLLGIGVRLAAMQQEAKVDSEKLIHGIASTKKQAARSATSARRIARRKARR